MTPSSFYRQYCGYLSCLKPDAFILKRTPLLLWCPSQNHRTRRRERRPYFSAALEGKIREPNHSRLQMRLPKDAASRLRHSLFIRHQTVNVPTVQVLAVASQLHLHVLSGVREPSWIFTSVQPFLTRCHFGLCHCVCLSQISQCLKVSPQSCQDASSESLWSGRFRNLLSAPFNNFCNVFIIKVWSFTPEQTYNRNYTLNTRTQTAVGLQQHCLGYFESTQRMQSTHTQMCFKASCSVADSSWLL